MISTTTATTAVTAIAFALIGSTSAMEGHDDHDVTFSSPIGFTQYADTCEGQTLYDGSINKISMLDTGSFCVIDTIMGVDGSETLAYSRLDVVDCTVDKVYDHWYKCTDDTCGDCEMEYRSHTAWESFEPENVMEQCYTYTFSLDDHDTVKAERSAPMDVTVGSFEETMVISFNFNEDAVEADVSAYLNFVKDNSCVAYGQPVAEPAVVVSKDNTTTSDEPAKPVEPVIEDPDISSSNTVVFSTITAAGLVMALATSMFL